MRTGNERVMAMNLEAETKCGFSISEKRKRVWNIELEILDEFDRICEQHGLHYFFIGGSSIGVERHQGFIPWDDDLDVGMLRSDFDKFIAVARNELKDGIFLQYGSSAKEIDETSYFCRIRKTNSTGVIREQLGQACNHGIFMEIYPFDNVPNSKLLQKIQIEFSSLFRQLLNYRSNKQNRTGRMRVINMMFFWASTEKIFKLFEKTCKAFDGLPTEMVNTVAMSNYAKTGECYYHRNDVENTVKKCFEGRAVQVASGNDSILRKCYGDYMQLPPEDHRGTHHNQIVYYDPDRPYAESLADGIPQRYFAGEFELGMF